ncbi:class I SAM-dependent methyltransferase [Bacillus alkalicellulosilyticus]|uniref:class I SAM-dependent methyltransferase n=1 Tax=Alkalihalobacterium alkalicellulosilyticum TaxID=1912214 RepID=UPI000996CB91|nr:methyltransferase domain-containing protein [Bacillus alkalicellulosilyticus]
MSTLIYVKNFIKDKNIASITPTSKTGVRDVCKKMDLSKRVVIVEYGPATGVFTNYLLNQITADSLIITIELNENFANYLKENINDSRVKVHHDSAENVVDIVKQYGETADYVISGIPFILMSPEMRNRVVHQTNQVLKTGGKFLPYQTCFQRNRHLKKYLQNHFSKVEDEYKLRNIPPMRVYEAVK